LVVRALADRKLAQLDAYVGYLEELGERDRASFLEDFVACGAARYYLQAAIECSADIGAHIVATDTSRRAEDYRSIFRVLGEESLIPADVAAAMEPTAALRNRLVHAYDQVDDARVHEMLGTAPPILRAFAQAIASHVERAAAAGTPER
jgi:uncharacterized protein YutE (UPF0331/DUF86 family)